MLRKTVCVLGLVWTTAGAAAQGNEAIYLLRQEMSMDAMPGRSVQTSLNAVAVDKAGRGQRVTTRVLWAEQRGYGHSDGTRSLDPEDSDDQQVMAVLQHGFEMQLTADGTIKDIQAKDKNAWQALVDQRPALTEALQPTLQQAQGLQPLPLPGNLRVGQELRQQHAQPGQGEISARHIVRTVTDNVAVLETTLQGSHLRGSGRQAVRRSDGMPLELQLELEQDAHGAVPANHRRLMLVNISDETVMDMSMDTVIHASYLADLKEMLSSPPFSAPSSDPQHFTLHPYEEGKLENWMLAPEDLQRFEQSLRFGMVEDHGSARPMIALGGDVGPQQVIADNGAWLSPMLTGVITAVALRDADGQTISALPATVTVRHMAAAERWRSNERDPRFPFRLPLQTTAAQLEAIDTITAQVNVDMYTWAGSEHVAAGAQSVQNPEARIQWHSPQRFTVHQPRPENGQLAGNWSVAIALDKDGQQLPAAVLNLSRQLPEADDSALPLDWEHRQVGWRQEIATAQPVAAVKLMNYRWEVQPRQWTFRDARTVPPVDDVDADAAAGND